ncbi:hypothetical protein ACFPMF_04850 [Larkinella bovis]|uniref:Uncharacterized protein n=1 Tax=Larkinella bovis TaxID=683041 RepID=A0ABW0I7L7_9BACT
MKPFSDNDSRIFSLASGGFQFDNIFLQHDPLHSAQKNFFTKLPELFVWQSNALTLRQLIKYISQPW